MDLGALFLLLALLIAISTYLYAPFMRRNTRHSAAEEHELSSLMAERERLINALQELDFDHSLGKIPAEDYPTQRAELLQKGADVLKKLDSFTPNAYPNGKRERNAVSRLENAATISDDELESMLAARRKTRKEKSAGFCPRCGKPILVSDRFCPNCGKALN